MCKQGACGHPSFPSSSIPVVLMAYGLVIRGPGDCSIAFPGDFTRGGESGAVRKSGAEEGMGDPFGLPSTSMFFFFSLEKVIQQ